MRHLEDGLNVADISWTRPRDVSNLPAYISMLSFRQICQTFELAAGAHVFERPLLKIGLQRQRQPNADKRIPPAPGLMVGEYELQGVILTERILNAVDFKPAAE